MRRASKRRRKCRLSASLQKEGCRGGARRQARRQPGSPRAALLLVDRRRATALLPYIADALPPSAAPTCAKAWCVPRSRAPPRSPDAYYTRLQGQLERLSQGMRVVVERQTDASLIGGVVTRIGDRIFDGSVRSRLQSMREALLPTV